MWKLHRYYLREVAVSAVLSFLVLFGIVLVASVSRGIDRAQGGNLLSAALITFYWAADTFPHLLAISLLIATVLTFARASQDREITAIRAAGISPRVPMVAAMIVGLLLSVVGSWAHHYLIPQAHYNKYRVFGEALREFITNTGMSGGKIAMGGFFLSFLDKDENGHFHQVVIKLNRGASGQLEAGTAYLSSEAWLDLSPDGETLYLMLRHTRDAAGRRVLRDTLRIGLPLRDLTDDSLRRAGDKDLTSDQLLANVERGLHDDPENARYTVHRRACFAAMPALFAPIGFCIGVLARDRGRMTAVLFAMVPLILFYASMMMAPTLMRATESPLSAWLPAAVIAVVGLPFCWRLLRV